MSTCLTVPQTVELKILVVDDDLCVRIAHGAFLKSMGCSVDVAETAQQAVAHLPQKYDLILLDMELPDAEGISVCQRIRADVKNRNTPVIVITSQFVDSLKSRCLAAGANEFIKKPATYFQIKDIVNRWC